MGYGTGESSPRLKPIAGGPAAEFAGTFLQACGVSPTHGNERGAKEYDALYTALTTLYDRHRNMGASLAADSPEIKGIIEKLGVYEKAMEHESILTQLVDAEYVSSLLTQLFEEVSKAGQGRTR